MLPTKLHKKKIIILISWKKKTFLFALFLQKLETSFKDTVYGKKKTGRGVKR